MLANLALLAALHFGAVMRRLRWLPFLAVIVAVGGYGAFLMLAAS